MQSGSVHISEIRKKTPNQYENTNYLKTKTENLHKRKQLKRIKWMTLTQCFGTRWCPTTRLCAGCWNTSVHTAMCRTLDRRISGTAHSGTIIAGYVAQRQRRSGSRTIRFRLNACKKGRMMVKHSKYRLSFYSILIWIELQILTSVLFLPSNKYVANTSS